jgi:hypothetical protein
MKKEPLLLLIAETGYNVGYGAKKHFATLDIVEKLPGWVTLFSAAAVIFSLFVPELEKKWITAAFAVISFSMGAVLLYDRDKTKYAEAGSQLTEKFHDLRMLYQAVKCEPDGAELPTHTQQHEAIQAAALKIGLPRHIFLSDWYAHYKFFWQLQTKWMDEQLHFKLIRDKLPLGFTATVLVLIVVGLAVLVATTPSLIEAICKGMV